MKIYVAHTREFDYQKELYDVIRQSSLNDEHEFILPHENSDEPFKSKDFLRDECDLMIAEISYPSTSLGIEMGWANLFKCPIVCIYKSGLKISDSLKAVTDKFVEYDKEDLVIKLQNMIQTPSAT